MAEQETSKLCAMVNERDSLIEQVNAFGPLSADNAEQAYSLLDHLNLLEVKIRNTRTNQFYKDADILFTGMQNLSDDNVDIEAILCLAESNVSVFLRGFAVHCVMFATGEAQEEAENIVDSIPLYFSGEQK